MTRVALALAASLALVLAAPALAGSQQDLMKECNHKAGDMKGDARQTFMKKCLAGEPTGKNAQQEKMTKCNAEAGKKKLGGEERKKFMSECLSH